MQLRRNTGAESGATTEERKAAVAARRAERAEQRADQADHRAARTEDRIDLVEHDADGSPSRPGIRERMTGQDRPSAERSSIRERVAGERRDRDDDRGQAGERAIVTEDDIRVMTGGEDLGIYRAHRRFGGFDLGAAIAGLLAAVGMTALLGSIAGAIGTVGYQLDVQRDAETLSAGGFFAGLIVVVLSFLVGGWVAGRVGRYDGGKNGLGTALMFVVLSAVLAAAGAAFGDEYDVLGNISVPQWFTSETTTATAVLSAVVALVVMVAAGWFGGVIGSRYHHKADAYLAEYAQGGRPVTAETLMADSRNSRRTLLHR